MKIKEQHVILPLLALVVIVVVSWTNRGEAETWYADKVDKQITALEPAEVASWIIQGHNDFVAILLQEPSGGTIDNIPALKTVDPAKEVRPQIASIPVYKKWIIITPDGTLSDQMAAVMTEDWQRRVFLLKGGKQQWDAQITADSIVGLDLTRQQRKALEDVRPFFHKTAEGEHTQQQERYVAPMPMLPPLLEAEPMEEEGC